MSAITKNYVIFGPGRVGRNMASYLKSLGHEATLVSHKAARDDAPSVLKLIGNADIVAAAIPDSAIEDWFDEWRDAIDERPAIHFSGALSIRGMRSAHPLYSFPDNLLDPAAMEKIAFAVEEGGPSLQEIFPGATNPSFAIAEKDRAYYHALAVISGNYAAFLWNETAKGFAARFDVAPETVFSSYLAGVVERFDESPLSSMTGPVARRDRASVEANLQALADEPKLHALYEAFLKNAWPEYPEDAE